MLSTVATRSDVGQGLSYFCPNLVVVGMTMPHFHLFGQLLGGFMELGWVRGSTVEASKAEYQSFVREQRQLEFISTKSRPDVGNILSSWSSKAGFRVRLHLYQVGNI